jgi:inosine-uridine nucleoside N-ribohydrolase
MTVADWWQSTEKRKNVHFMKGVQAHEVLELIVSRLSTLP